MIGCLQSLRGGQSTWSTMRPRLCEHLGLSGLRHIDARVAKGDTLTVAAMNGGFASSAHFSASFREMFGLEPSRLRGGTTAQSSGSSD